MQGGRGTGPGLRGDFYERINACIRMESLAREIYLSLAERFPACTLWPELAREEEAHAHVLHVIRAFQRVGHDLGLPEPPPKEANMRALGVARDFLSEVRKGHVTLTAAIDRAIEIEVQKAEMYLQEVVSKAPDSRTLSYLKRLLMDETRHRERIEAYRAAHFPKTGLRPRDLR